MPKGPTFSMPLFINPQDAILRMQLSTDLTGVEEVVSSGIIGAQLHVERLIDSKLQRQPQDSLFFIDSESFSGIAPNGLYRLEIPSGLVRQDVPQVVKVSSGTTEGPFTTYEDINPGLMKFDYKRGYLYVDESFGDSHIRVQCETGFNDGTRYLDLDMFPYDALKQYLVGDQVHYLEIPYTCMVQPPAPGVLPTNATYWDKAYVPMEQIPNAIYEAILALIPMVFNSQQTTNRSQEATSQYQALASHAELLLQPYVRTKGFTFRAI